MSTDGSFSLYQEVSRYLALGDGAKAADVVRNGHSPVAEALRDGDITSAYYRLPFISDLFCEYLEFSFARRLRPLAPTEPYNAWYWSYLVEAAILGLSKTGASFYRDATTAAIEHALRYRDCERGFVDTVRGRSLKSWGVSNKIPGQWTNVATTAGRIVYPIASYIELAESRGWNTPPEWLQACTDAIDEFVPEFVVDDGGERGLFSRPAMNDFEPLNHVVSVGRALLVLGRITGNQEYSRMAAQIAAFFRSALVTEEPGHYAWPYRPTLHNPSAGPPAQFWKADVDLSFVVDCYHSRMEFGPGDIGKFVGTLRNAVVREDGLYCHVTRGRNVPIEEKISKITDKAYGLCGWQVLAPFDETVQSLIEDAMIRHASAFPSGWLGTPRAALAYAMKT